jgi:methyl-accepting chemotaxis protein
MGNVSGFVEVIAIFFAGINYKRSERMMMKKIQTKMMIMFTILIAFVIISIQSIIFMHVNEQLQENINTESNLLVENVSEDFYYILDTIRLDLNRYSKTELILSFFNATNKEEVKEKILNDFEVYISEYTSISSLYMGTKDKEFITSFNRGNSQPADYDPTTRDWYKDAAAAKGEVVWSEPYESASAKEFVVTGSKAIMSSDGKEVVGVIAFNYALEEIQKKIKDMDISYDGQVFIIDPNKKAVAYPNKNGEDVSSEPIFQALEKAADNKFSSTLDGKDMEVYYKTLDKFGWNIGVMYPVETINEDLNALKTTVYTISIIALIVTLIVVYIIAKQIATPITKLSVEVQKVAEGDLTVKLESKTKDEVGQLTNHFNEMVAQMNQMVSTIQSNVTSVEESSQQVSHLTEETIASSKEIASAMDSVAKNATHQANEIESILMQMENMSESVSEVNTSMNAMAQLSSEVDSSSNEGMDRLHQLSSASSDSTAQLEEVETVMTNLVERVNTISNVMATIRSISEQTNLLALNASIEAARAGEHGKGFAVVATEVRKLAEQSREATDYVGTTIKGIQEETEKAVLAMNQTRQMANDQQQSVMNTERAFESITTAADKLAQSVKEVTIEMDKIAHEQSTFAKVIQVFAAGSEETAAASEEINASTDEQLTYLQHVATTSDHLQVDSQKLKELVQHFRVKNEEE